MFQIGKTHIISAVIGIRAFGQCKSAAGLAGHTIMLPKPTSLAQS
jgi:hypothetical protein